MNIVMHTKPVLSELELKAIEGAIDYIHRYGVEGISLKSIAEFNDLKAMTVTSRFYSINSLLINSLEFSFDRLINYILGAFGEPGCVSTTMEKFWGMLVNFSEFNQCKASLICHYLKKPFLFPLLDTRITLMRPIDSILVRVSDLKSTNESIRFIVFVQLLQTAFRASSVLPSSLQHNGRQAIANYFHQNIEGDIKQWLQLPIC